MIYNHPLPTWERPWNRKTKRQMKKGDKRYELSIPKRLLRKGTRSPGTKHGGGVYFPYELAQIIVQYYGIESKHEYRRFIKYLRCEALPSDPHLAYRKNKWVKEHKDDGGQFWENYYVFLGKERGIPNAVKHTRFLKQDEAAKWVHANMSEEDRMIGGDPVDVWRAWWRKRGGIPDYIPKTPRRVYGDDWKGYSYWIGRSNTADIQVKQGIQPLLVIASIHGEPSNVIEVFTEVEGLLSLRDSLIHNKQIAHAVFDIKRKDKDAVRQILATYCPVNDEGLRIVVNIHELIDALERILERTDLRPITETTDEIS